ncbi:hypothetical protein [uncultured Polaribacter sp.]|uniref:hypothetical protein n=1 Tax=uncultured Polaribacter sp. TaxID=174711 RepID=UPI0026200409|nr:hypothetical protein [uncultured Polaribacter sp.]
MNAHIDLYQEVEPIIEMNSKDLKIKSIDELSDLKAQLKNVCRRIKTDRKRFDKTKSFYRDSGYKMNDLDEKIDEIKKIIKDKGKQTEKIKDLSKKPKYEYYIIAKLLATNKIEIQEEKFLYKGIKYMNGGELSKIINNEYGINNQAFTQYLTDYRSKGGEKYFLKTFDSDDKPDKKNIKILKKLNQYFSDNQIIVSNKEFISSFKTLENKNLI